VCRGAATTWGDMARGKMFGDSARKHVPKGIKEAAEGIVWQKGSGKPIRKRRRYNDIFEFDD